MRFHLRAPLAANPRMENLFERASFRSVLEDYGAKPFTYQAAVTRKDLPPKLSNKFFSRIRITLDQFVRGLIGVKKSRGRKNLAQAIAKSRFARGNSAGDPDDRHLVMEYWSIGVKNSCRRAHYSITPLPRYFRRFLGDRPRHDRSFIDS